MNRARNATVADVVILGVGMAAVPALLRVWQASLPGEAAGIRWNPGSPAPIVALLDGDDVEDVVGAYRKEGVQGPMLLGAFGGTGLAPLWELPLDEGALFARALALESGTLVARHRGAALARTGAHVARLGRP